MDEAKMLDQVDDYLSGRLAGDELDVFEEALLDNTVLQREVAVAQEMRRGLSEATDQHFGNARALASQVAPDN
jgi:hypothetical protein